ncbi:TPA: heparinase II/III family protein [Campylobacter coli]|nr:heparinase II/III family protein [Campylobacter coli]
MKKFFIKEQIKLELRSNSYFKYSLRYLFGEFIVKCKHIFFVIPFILLYLFYLDKRTYRAKNIMLFFRNGYSFFGSKRTNVCANTIQKSICIFFFGQYVKNDLDLLSLEKKYTSIIGYKQLNEQVFSVHGYNMKISLPVNYVCSKSRTVTFEMQAWRFLNNLWGKFFRSNDLKVFYDILIYMDDWLNNKQIMFRFYDMAVGIRAIHISLALEISFSIKLERYFRKLLYDLATIHLSELTNDKKISVGNHAIWQMIGLKYLSDTLNFEHGANFANEKISRMIDSAFDANGVCMESSSFYHVYNINLLNAIKNIGIFSMFENKICDIINKANKITPYLLERKTHKYIQIGDSQHIQCKANVHIDKNNDYKVNKMYIKDLNSSGYQWVYNDNFFLVFHKPKGIIHAHNDFLSFILYYNDIEIFADPGVYNYSYEKIRSWFISDKAHNTFGVKEKQISPSECNFKRSKIIKIKTHNDDIILNGYNFTNGLFKHKREIIINSKNYNIDFIDNFSVKYGFTPEIRYIFGKNITLKEHKKNNIEIFYNEKKIADFYLDSCCACNIYNKNDNFAWISREWDQKESTACLVLNFNKQIYSAKSKFKFII